MFEAGSLHDRLARAIYAEAPVKTSSGGRAGFDLANAVNAPEAALARKQAVAAASVLADYQQLWVHLMYTQMRPGDDVEVPGLFPDVYTPRRTKSTGEDA